MPDPEPLPRVKNTTDTQLTTYDRTPENSPIIVKRPPGLGSGPGPWRAQAPLLAVIDTAKDSEGGVAIERTPAAGRDPPRAWNVARDFSRLRAARDIIFARRARVPAELVPVTLSLCAAAHPLHTKYIH